MTATLYCGDTRAVLATLPERSVQCVVTSPPYFGLRDYGHAGQIGLERTPDAYVAALVEVFRQVKRVLRDDGTLWLNLGDSYAAHPGQRKETDKAGAKQMTKRGSTGSPSRHVESLKPKDLIGIPWAVATALRDPFYAGSIKRLEDRVWLAAMLDAEGCMFIQKRKAGQHNGQGYYRQNDNYGPGLEIANTSLAVVERIMALVGKGSICSQGPEQNGRRRQTIYRWNLRTTESREFVRELYPYLVAKQHQARLLYGCPSSGERAEAAHEALKILHNGGETAVDFAAPASLYEPGYYLRCDIVWSKLNPMPESVTDRPTKAHEYLFLLTKSPTYYYDAAAIAEPVTDEEYRTVGKIRPTQEGGPGFEIRGGLHNQAGGRSTRNARTVWTIATQPYSGAHFATFPEELARRCILAGSSAKACESCGAPWERVTEREGDGSNDASPAPASAKALRMQEVGERRDANRRGPGTSLSNNPNLRPPSPQTVGWQPTCPCPTNTGAASSVVLDPFGGSGTVSAVACGHGRRAIHIDLNPSYIELARQRIGPMLCEVAA